MVDCSCAQAASPPGHAEVPPPGGPEPMPRVVCPSASIWLPISAVTTWQASALKGRVTATPAGVPTGPGRTIRSNPPGQSAGPGGTTWNTCNLARARTDDNGVGLRAAPSVDSICICICICQRNTNETGDVRPRRGGHQGEPCSHDQRRDQSAQSPQERPSWHTCTSASFCPRSKAALAGLRGETPRIDLYEVRDERRASGGAPATSPIGQSGKLDGDSPLLAN
jgi:hypothetical protein